MTISFEQIETLRKNANISYEEAKSILEKYDGDMIKAIVDLERQGKIKSETEKTRTSESSFVNSVKKLFNKGANTRFIVKNKEKIIVNLSINFMIFATLFGIHVVVIGLILALLLGYKIRIKKEKGSVIDVKTFVDHATENVKSAVNDITKDEPVKEDEVKQNNDNPDYSEITIE